MLKSLSLSLAIVLGLSAPALAISDLADVPSTWPTEGSFGGTVSKDVADPLAPIPADAADSEDE